MACNNPGPQKPGGGDADPCEWRDLSWSDEFTNSCSSMVLDNNQIGFCYEEPDPLVVDVEVIAVDLGKGRLDLGICLSSDDASVYRGNSNTPTTYTKDEVTSGSIANAADYLPRLGLSFLAVPDGTVPCMGATAVLDDGDIASGAEFRSKSWYWKNWVDRSQSEQRFGATGSDGLDADHITLPAPAVQLLFSDVVLGLPGLVELPSSAVDHWPHTLERDGSCS